jgi:Flavodoxin
MDVLIIYESLYGNTQAIAGAIADGLREAAEADVAVVAAPQVSGDRLVTAGLLVIGGPTHVHGMTSARSRQAAQRDAAKHHLPEPDVTQPAMRDWFDDIAPGDGRRAAAFDTRIDKPKILTGSAAHGIADRLRRHGYDVVDEQSFLVEGTAGPIHEGELDRAHAWGRTLAARVTTAVDPR